MARGPKYSFGDEDFNSKDAVRKRASKIFSSYRKKEPIDEESPDFKFIGDLLLNHIEAPQKIGAGVHYFYVDKSPNHSTPCFWISRVLGPPTDFGVGSCLDGPYQINRASLRELIRDHVAIFKAGRLSVGAGSFVSDFSGETFSATDAVVDHDPPFDLLIDRFFSSRSEDPRTSLLTKPTDASSIPVWIDQDLSDQFRRFHAQANLRLVHRRENLSQIKRIHNLAFTRQASGSTQVFHPPAQP